VRCIGKKKEKNNPFTYNQQVQTKDVLFNPVNPVNPDSKIIYGKYAIKTTMSAKILRSPTRRATTNDSIFSGNYTRSSQLFESGFTGFRGLTITSLVSVEGYYEMVLSYQGFSPMRNASAKKRVKIILYK
jgi:hypothetical protein